MSTGPSCREHAQQPAVSGLWMQKQHLRPQNRLRRGLLGRRRCRPPRLVCEQHIRGQRQRSLQHTHTTLKAPSCAMFASYSAT
jgi:hypothetical protein